VLELHDHVTVDIGSKIAAGRLTNSSSFHSDKRGSQGSSVVAS
jgi:hypothetical protein